MLLLTINLFIISLLAERKSVFRSDAVLENENDPNRDTIYGEFIVAFKPDCVVTMTNAGRDIIQEFIDLFDCYEENTNVVDAFPNIIDHWIEMDKKEDCDDDDIEVEWDDYCINSVEENEVISANGINQCASRTVESALWNLNVASPQISNKIEYIKYDSSYNPNIDIIIMDTGVDFSHPQFTGIQTQQLYDAYSGQPFDSHGTHCAGTVLGKDYGAFRAESTQFRLLDVRILDQHGSGTTTAVLNGYDAIINYLNNNSGKKVIINMSFGGGNYVEFNTRLASIRQGGGFSFAAAGNSNVDASTFSPASSGDTITVGASDQNNNRAWFSNFGTSVNIWAPGTNIKSATVGGGSASWDGTSMATPLVAGIAANILANNPSLDFEGIKAKLLKFAVNDVNDGKGNTASPRVQASCTEYGVGVEADWGETKNYGGWQLFEGGVSKWYDCPSGYVLGGFWKNYCQNLWCLEEMKCVRPAGNVISQTCYSHNIWSSFDSKGTVQCNDGYLIRGIYASGNCDGLYCWEELNCCQYDKNVIAVVGEKQTHDWWSCFDGSKTGWCNVDNNEYITGFMRSGGHELYNLEEAVTRNLAYTTDGSMAIGGDAVRINVPDHDIYIPGGVSIESKYLFEGIAALLMINLICFTINCTKKGNNRSKRGYKVVTFDSSTDIENPDQ